MKGPEAELCIVNNYVCNYVRGIRLDMCVREERRKKEIGKLNSKMYINNEQE